MTRNSPSIRCMNTFGNESKVAVIGAGIAGSALAQALMDEGAAVHVFDKSCGPGGRMATRRCAWTDAERHSRITAPVALLWGADDPWFPLGKVRPMVTQFRKPAELHEIAGGKLFVHEEKPHEWARLAYAFLERAARTSPAVSAGAA